MASNDGARLTVFGLTFRQHDNGSMLRILREYHQVPENPGNRTDLFVAISALAQNLDEETSEGIKAWLQGGAVVENFPSSNAVAEREFGRGPISTVQTPGMVQPTALIPTNDFGRPRHPPVRGRGRGNFGHAGRGGGREAFGGRGGPNMPLPLFIGGNFGMGPPHGQGIPAFIGDGRLGMGGFGGYGSSAAFRGPGNSLVEADSLAPEFPTANTPHQGANTNVIDDQEDDEDDEDDDMGGYDRGGYGGGYGGYGAYGSRGPFIGPGNSLVDADSLALEFPTANTHPRITGLDSSIVNERNTLDQAPRVASRPPIATGMADMSFEEFQEEETRRFSRRLANRQGIQIPDDEMDGHHERSIQTLDEDDEDDENEDEDGDFMMNHIPTRNRQPGEFRRYRRPNHNGQHRALPTTDPNEPIPEGHMECCICTNSFAPEKFPPSAKITSTCQHTDDIRVCLLCIEQSIRVPIDDGILNLLNCPLCPAKFSTEEIKLYATARIFARYQYLLMSLNPDMVFCLAKDCGHGEIHSLADNNSPMMECEKCTFRTCVHHKLPWHEGQDCDEFDCDDSQVERLEQEEATAKLLSKLNSKICPTCKQGVDRTDGCDHIMCRCGGAWCFECMASWENIMAIGPEAHATTCPNHPHHIAMSASQKQSHAAKILESVHGGKVSEALQKARENRNVRIREGIRPLALEAAEKRAKEEARARREEGEEGRGSAKKVRKTKLIPAWEEKR